MGNLHVGAGYQPRSTVRAHITLNCQAMSEPPDQCFVFRCTIYPAEFIEINKIVNLLIYDLRTIGKIGCR